MTEKKSKDIKKHIATIHCSNSLSLLQRKISNVLLYHAYDHLLKREVHQITVKQICTLIGCNSNNHVVIKDALKALISTIIEWNVFDDLLKEEDWSASSILASVRIKGPTCSYSYSPRMRELLFSPSIYGRVNLDVQAKFRSNYGLALYENCVRYKSLPSTKWFDLAVFRNLMGIPDEIYPIFRDFKKRVLDKAVEEVNTYSDLFLNYELSRVGRRVTRLRFNITVREKKPKLNIAAVTSKKTEGISDNNAAIFKSLQDDFCCSVEQIKKILLRYETSFIEEKITLIKNSRRFKNGEIDNLAGYLHSSLVEDYKAPKTSRLLISEKKIALDKQREANIVEQKNLRKEQDSLLHEETEKFLSSLDENQKSDLELKFKDHIAKLPLKTVRQEYEKQGLHSERILAFYHAFVRRLFPESFKCLSKN